MLLALVAPSRVGVVVYPGVSGELVRAGKLLAAARKLASVRLLSSVCSNVPRLVLQAVESLIAKRTLVRTRQLIRRLRGLRSGERTVWLDNGNR
jgi:hypothetical protein